MAVMMYLTGGIQRNYDDGKKDIVAPPNYTEPVAKDYPDCFEIIYRLVKPERITMKGDRGAEYWWQFLRMRKELYQTIAPMERVLVVSEVTKHLTFDFRKIGYVFTANLDVFAFSKFYELCLVQNSLHHYWAWQYSAWLKRDLKYSPGNAFETFPFTQNLSQTQESQLEQIGEAYHEHRKQLMLKTQLGLTKTYNLFHSPKLAPTATADMEMEDKTFEKKFGKDAALLRKHLAKTEGTCPFNAAVEGIIKLRQLHVEMDNAVLEAYGWSDVLLHHDFYEVYLPENDRIRYTIPPAGDTETTVGIEP